MQGLNKIINNHSSSLLLIFFFTGLIAAQGCNYQDAANPVTDKTSADAVIVVDGPYVPPAGPNQTKISGKIVAISPDSVTVESEPDSEKQTVAISANVDVWEDGDLVKQSTLATGDTVDLFCEAVDNSSSNNSDAEESDEVGTKEPEISNNLQAVRINISARGNAN